MTTKYAFLACLLISSAATAMTGQSNSELIHEPTILLAKNHTTWSFVAPTNSHGLTKVREFHDMGTSGIQQIDYVVDCTNQIMAMSGFQIFTSPDSKPVGFVAPKTQKLSFYAPAIDHDKQIASNACKKLVAINSYTNGN